MHFLHKLFCFVVVVRPRFFVHRHSVGDTKVPFCLQSCVKPLEYAIAVNDLGSELTHHFVGKEPSGFRFNKLSLNEDGERLALFRHITEREGCFISTQLLTITSPHLCHYWAIARSHLSHSGLVVCSGYYAGRPFGLPFMKYPHNPIYLFNNSLLPQWLGAVCDNVYLALVQISHTTRW